MVLYTICNFNQGVIPLADFCECGSLVIDGRCSNKKCTLRSSAAAASIKKAPAGSKASGGASGKSTTAKAAVPKKTNPRRASKVITYNLYDLQKSDGADNERTERG